MLLSQVMFSQSENNSSGNEFEKWKLQNVQKGDYGANFILCPEQNGLSRQRVSDKVEILMQIFFHPYPNQEGWFVCVAVSLCFIKWSITLEWTDQCQWNLQDLHGWLWVTYECVAQPLSPHWQGLLTDLVIL